MPRVVKLGDLLPEDIEFEMPDGKKFLAPGDPPLAKIMELANLFEQSSGLGGGEAAAPDSDGVELEVLERLDRMVLDILRMRDPDLAESPFGVLGIQHFVAELLKAYGFIEAAEDPPPTPAKRRPAANKRSPRSSGSRS